METENLAGRDRKSSHAYGYKDKSRLEEFWKDHQDTGGGRGEDMAYITNPRTRNPDRHVMQSRENPAAANAGTCHQSPCFPGVCSRRDEPMLADSRNPRTGELEPRKAQNGFYCLKFSISGPEWWGTSHAGGDPVGSSNVGGARGTVDDEHCRWQTAH